MADVERRVQFEINRLNRSYKKRLNRLRVLRFLMCVTVFITTYALILPAITMEKDEGAVCGMIDHTHTEECYDQEGALICGLAEHEHDMGCFSPRVEFIDTMCGYMYEHSHTDACYADDVLICSMEEHTHTRACRSYVLTAAIDEATGIEVFALPDSFDADPEQIRIRAVETDSASAEELIREYMAESVNEISSIRIFDVQLLLDGEEIEPNGPINIAFTGISGDPEAALVFHVDEQSGIVTDMNAFGEDGQLFFETDHCSLFGVVDTIPGSGKAVTASVASAAFDCAGGVISSLTLNGSNTGAGNNNENNTSIIQYSDDGGTSWTDDSTSSKVITGTGSYTLTASSALSGANVGRIYRIKAYKGNNNVGYSPTLNIFNITEAVKPGFESFLAGSYTDDFHQPALGSSPTLAQLLTAFGFYQSLPDARIISSEPYGINNISDAEISVEGSGSYTYAWYYLDEDHEWKATGCTADTLVFASFEDLPEYGADLKCYVYEGSVLKSIAGPTFVNPRKYDFDQAVNIINTDTGLHLNAIVGNGKSYDLRIDGGIFTKAFWYAGSASNPDVPFYDAESYKNHLCKAYVEAYDKAISEGSSAADAQAAGKAAFASEWNFYLYDLFDPDAQSMDHIDPYDGVSYPNASSYSSTSAICTYGDEILTWPKADNGSFHTTTKAAIDALDYSFLEDGIDYSNFISKLDKFATADEPGDANIERKFDIHLIADGQAKADAPVALLFEISSNWYMFDMEHANGQISYHGTDKGTLGEITELGTIYDFKWALYDLIEYIKNQNKGNNLVMGVTEVQHDGWYSMFTKDADGNACYVSNNYAVLRQALSEYDVFGNCEHVHYDKDSFSTAVSGLANNLSGWKDMYGADIRYSDIQKCIVIIGGPTENVNGEDGYNCKLEWGDFASNGMDSVYGIRTDDGIPYNTGILSWLDIAANNGTPYGADPVSGVFSGNGFTKKYVATSREDIFDALVDIVENERGKKQLDIIAEDKFVEDPVVKDTVSKEFEFDTAELVYARLLNKDGSLMYETVIDIENEQISCVDGSGNTVAVSNASFSFSPSKSDWTSLSVSFDEPQHVHYNTINDKGQITGSGDADFIAHQSFSVVKKANKTTEVSHNFGKLYNTKKLELVFGIQAREDYLGSNNVYTNTGTPQADYYHYKTDEPAEHYYVGCKDTPMVNVPLDFRVIDGNTVTVPVGTMVDLEDLDADPIPDQIEDLMNNYAQTNGELSYQWQRPDGSLVNLGSLSVVNGQLQGERPDLSTFYTPNAAGNYRAMLKLTFTPLPAQTTSVNFHNDDVTPVAVTAKTRAGNVGIIAVGEDSLTSAHIEKKWSGSGSHPDTIQFKLKDQFGTYVLDGSSAAIYTLSSSNDWMLNVADLPAMKSVDGTAVVLTYTAEELVPAGYKAQYENDAYYHNEYEGFLDYSFTPDYKSPDASTKLKLHYTYNGEDIISGLIPATAQQYNAETTYTGTIENLATDVSGNAYSGDISRVDYCSSSGQFYTAFVGEPLYGEVSKQTAASLYVFFNAPAKADKTTYTVHYVNRSTDPDTYGSFTANKANYAAGALATLTSPAKLPIGEYEITSITNDISTNYDPAPGSCCCTQDPVYLQASVLVDDANKNKDWTLTVSGPVNIGTGVFKIKPPNNAVGTTYTAIYAGNNGSIPLPPGEYEITDAVNGGNHMSPLPTASTVTAPRSESNIFSFPFTFPCNVASGTELSVYYTLDGTTPNDNKPFTWTADQNYTEGQSVVISTPELNGSQFAITDITRPMKINNKNTNVSFYRLLDAGCTTRSEIKSVTCYPQITIENMPSDMYDLPATGGRGTLGSTLLGSFLIIVSALAGLL